METERLRDFYDSIAEGYADEWYSNTSLNPVLVDFIQHLPSNPEVLDVGCGAGYHTRFFAEKGASATGIDISGRAIAIAKERAPMCSFYVADMLAPPAEGLSQRFDGVLSCATLGHVPLELLPQALGTMAAYLKPNGLALMIFAMGNDERRTGSGDYYGEVWETTTYLHSLNAVTHAAAACGLPVREEWQLPAEHANRGYRCLLLDKPSCRHR